LAEVKSSSGPTYSVIVITDLTRNPPLHMSHPTPGAHNSGSFLAFIAWCVLNQVIIPGDRVVLDNCPIHRAAGIHDTLCALEMLGRFRFVYLPRYSPELNPAENVFSLIKFYLREHRADNLLPFVDQIIAAFAGVSLQNMEQFYQHCLNPDLY